MPAPRFAPRTSDDLSPEPPTPHLIRDVCRPSGSVLMFGRTGIGKSRLLWQLACGWAQGHATFGLTPARPLRITFVEADMFREDFESMIKEYSTHGVMSSPNLCWFARDDETPMMVDGAFGQVLHTHNSAWATDLTIFDAVPDMHLGDANDQRTAYQTLRALQTASNNRAYLGVLVRRKGSTQDQGDDSDTIDSMLGSQGWGRQASTVWQMTGVPSLVWVKHRLCPRPAPIVMAIDSHGCFALRTEGARGLIASEAAKGFTSAAELAARIMARPEYAALPQGQQYKERMLRQMIASFVEHQRPSPV